MEEFDENFQIIIEGSAGTSHLSDIAIDDVALLDESECIDDTLIETTTTEVEESKNAKKEKISIFFSSNKVNK